MRNTLETRLGIFFALALIVSAIILEMVGFFDFFQRNYRVYASFKNVQELKKGDTVKLAGVEIGHVDDIKLITVERTNILARVTMKIRNDYTNTIRADSRAIIKFAGLMGQNFVSIEGGRTNVFLQDGSALEVSEQPDLSGLMAKLQDVASSVEDLGKSFGPENMSKLLGPLNDFILQERPRLDAIVANVQTVSSNVAAGTGTVGKLVNDDTLYNNALGAVMNVRSASAEAKGLIDQAQAAVADARQIIGQVRTGTNIIGQLTTNGELYSNTLATIRNIRDITDKVNHGSTTNSVSTLINDDKLIKNAKMSLQKLDKATDSMEDQGPLSVLGIIIGTLF